MLIIPFVLLTIFSGFRFNVGIDYKTYLLLFEWGKNGDLQVTSEPLFQYFLFFCRYLLNGNEQMFFLCSAIITNFFVYKFISKLSTNAILSILLYFCIISFYLYTFNAVRQWIATSIFLYSLIFFKEKKYYVYILINLFAALIFHMSLLFIFPIIFLTKFNIKDKIRISGFLIAIIIGFLAKYLIAVTNYDSYNDVNFDSTVDLKVYLFLIISILIEFSRKRYIAYQDPFSKILININYLSIIILLILIFQNSGGLILLFKRIHNYFFAVHIIFIPFIISKWAKINGLDKIINLILYITLPILFLLTIFYNGENNLLLPYNFNFNIFN